MRAVQLHAWQSEPVIVDVEVPRAGPGQVVIKVAGAGACHSDLHIMSTVSDGMFPWGPPFTLGHENAGWVHELGEGVEGFSVGEPVALHGPWGCGACDRCLAGNEQYCSNQAAAVGHGAFGGGLGLDGGMAQYMLVYSSRHLVKIPGGLDPVAAAPLTDAGLTPYHAVKLSLAKLIPGSTALVIGVGGLGHMAVQFLEALTGANIIAADTRPEALELARACGAETTVLSNSDDAAAQIKEATGGRGCEVILDFVGVDATMALGVASGRQLGDLTIVGGAGGSYPMGLYTVPYEMNMRSMYWGSRSELAEVLALAERGDINVAYTEYQIENALQAYHDLEAGQVKGRAVIVP
jgi:propanol-preferring alcohol dehydrogenase